MRKGPVIMWTILGTLGGLAALALVLLLTGAYDVAASSGHTPLTRWVLGTLMERSMEVRLGSVHGSPPTDPTAIHDGFREYDGMCVGCHGAPGVERGPVGRGMEPTPPDLDKRPDLNDREIFWVVDHGVKLAGMPAFGATESREMLWSIVAFVKQLPGMTPAQYAAWRGRYGARNEVEETREEQPNRATGATSP